VSEGREIGGGCKPQLFQKLADFIGSEQKQLLPLLAKQHSFSHARSDGVSHGGGSVRLQLAARA
jgi:hypothetical protein